MSGWLELGAACTLLASTTSVAPTEHGWREAVTYEVFSEGGCKRSALNFEPGTTWTELGGRRRLGDGTRGQLGPERFDIQPQSTNGEARVVVLLPEMLSGDKAEITVVREWESHGAYRWRPGREGPAWADLSAGKTATLSTFGGVQIDRKKGAAWVGQATPSDQAHWPHPAGAEPPAPAQVSESGLSHSEALERMSHLLLQPRGLEREAVSGDAALDRGIVDDRGWARTLVALCAGGPDQVTLAYRMPVVARPGASEDALAEIPVLATDAGLRPLPHPATPAFEGPAYTGSSLTQVAWDPAEPWSRAQAELLLNRELTLSWEGDPAYELAPGRGSRVDALDELEVAADQAAIVVVPVPPQAESVTVEADGARWMLRPGSVLLALDRGDKRTVSLKWGHPDAPTYGEKTVAAGLRVDQQVRADGRISWEGGKWWLSTAGGQPILPSREALLRALQYRFAIASYPEPGLAPILRGRTGEGFTVAEDFRSAIRERAIPGQIGLDPLWPRRIMKARKNGILTSTETALTAVRWAEALRLEADWVLVRPAPSGEGAAVSPAGYDVAVVRIGDGEEVRWMDPSCAVCAPWELPPDLEGASALGWEVGASPDPTPGSMVVRQLEDGAHEYSLTASAALWLRLSLSDELKGTRAELLIAALSVGGDLRSFDGLAEAGAPVTVVIEGGEPRRWPAAEPDGSTWMSWVGPRSWPATGADAQYESDAIVWSRTTQEGVTTETATVRERRIPASTWAELEAARAGTAAQTEAGPDEDPAEPGAENQEEAGEKLEEPGEKQDDPAEKLSEPAETPEEPAETPQEAGEPSTED